MNTIPHFSIIMPSYNHGHLIKQSIQSVVNQDFINWELLIIDNNSSDKTKEIIKSFEDPRIKSYTIENQGIIAKSRNYGLKMSIGKWIAFLDSDDLFKKNKLSEVYKLTLKVKEGIIYHKCYSIINNKKSNKIIGNFHSTKNNYLKLLLFGNRIIFSSICIKKTHLKENYFSEEKNLITVEDFDLILKLLKNGIPLNYISKSLGGYRISDTSLSRSKNHFENLIFLLEREKLYLNQKFIKKLDTLILYIKIKGLLVTPEEGYKSLKRHNFFSLITLKSYLINTLNYLKQIH